jgi:hypothetical protein
VGECEWEGLLSEEPERRSGISFVEFTRNMGLRASDSPPVIRLKRAAGLAAIAEKAL